MNKILSNKINKDYFNLIDNIETKIETINTEIKKINLKI